MIRMKCPACGKQAISFSSWGHGINAFRTHCMHCGAKLKANKVVVWGFVVTLLVVAATMAAVISTMPPGTDDEPYRFFAIIVPALVGAAITYWFGGYNLRDE